jgi:hypothetical protein
MDKDRERDIGALIRLLAYAKLEAERLGLGRIAEELEAILQATPNVEEALRPSGA